MVVICGHEGVSRRPWDVSFGADLHEVAGLRKALKIRLTLWGLPEVVEAAQVCVTELATNVIHHVGLGTPATLTVSLRGAYVRLEMRDPDARALPTLLDAVGDAESGRGMALIDAFTDHRWGVVLRGDSKVVWCELATDLPVPDSSPDGGHGAVVEEAIGLIADLLHWLRVQDCDPYDALDRAMMHYEAEAQGPT